MYAVFTANRSHTMQLMSGAKLRQSSLWVELQPGPLLGQLDCLEYGSNGFLGYLREHSLLPCTLSNLLRDRLALLMISRQSLHSLNAQVTPQ